MGEPIVIIPGNDDGANGAAVEQAETAAVTSTQAAAVSGDAAGLSLEGAEASTNAAQQSGEAATVSTEAAAVSVAGAAESQATLAGVVELLNTLPDRLSTAINANRVPVSDPLANAPASTDEGGAVESDSKPKPVERKPDKRPSDTHWYTRKRGSQN